MTQSVLQEALDEAVANWMERVSDEHYHAMCAVSK